MILKIKKKKKPIIYKSCSSKLRAFLLYETQVSNSYNNKIPRKKATNARYATITQK